MAEKKTVTKKVAQEVEDIDVKDVQSEEIKKLMKQVEALQKQINATKTQTEEQAEEKMVRFISLARGSVLLKGTAPRPYEIEGRFSDRMFSESEAKAIVNLMGNYMREGFVYIDDAEFVKSVGLAESYKTLLTPEVLQNLFNQSSAYVISAYENATDGQRQIILDMVTSALERGENVDANVLTALSKLSGVNLLDIEKIEE